MFATTGTLVPQRSAEGFEGECNDKRAFLVSFLKNKKNMSLVERGTSNEVAEGD
jgi:hypothetical protein